MTVLDRNEKSLLAAKEWAEKRGVGDRVTIKCDMFKFDSCNGATASCDGATRKTDRKPDTETDTKTDTKM